MPGIYSNRLRSSAIVLRANPRTEGLLEQAFRV